jgi:hypothetical protein
MMSKPFVATLLVACATLLPVAASADPKVIPNPYADATRTAQSNMRSSLVGTLTDLAKTADDSRFTAHKPLGFYYGGRNLPFKSPYAKQSQARMAEFAYDLDALKAKSGCSYASYVEALKKGTGKQQALAKTYLGYNKQRDFARSWWSKNDPAFEKALTQDLWLHESILDASYLIDRWWQKLGDKNKEWMDNELNNLANRK